MHLNSTLPLLVVVLTVGCGGVPPDDVQVEDAKAHLKASLAAADRARTALELLGVLPTYTCGEPRRTFAGRVVNDLRAEVACVTVTTEEDGPTADVVRLTFADGCMVQGHALSGPAVFRYSGGEARLSLEADLRDLSVDGARLGAKAGYGTCGDEKRVWGTASGALQADGTWSTDTMVGLREGAPLIGGTTLVLNGTTKVTRGAGTDSVTMTGLEYEPGAYSPKAGTLTVTTADGHTVRVTFTEVLWKLGQAEVQVDDRAPVTVPVVR